MTLLRRIQDARDGKNMTVVCRMASGWVVLGDDQFLRGYCLLLSDPPAPSLTSLDRAGRSQFLLDMCDVGDAVLKVTSAYKINYEILGNSDSFLHAHIFPRYKYESDEFRGKPVYYYPDYFLKSKPFDYERDKDLIDRLALELVR